MSRCSNIFEPKLIRLSVPNISVNNHLNLLNLQATPNPASKFTNSETITFLAITTTTTGNYDDIQEGACLEQQSKG
jgi:hypothetical protein